MSTARCQLRNNLLFGGGVVGKMTRWSIEFSLRLPEAMLSGGGNCCGSWIFFSPPPEFRVQSRHDDQEIQLANLAGLSS